MANTENLSEEQVDSIILDLLKNHSEDLNVDEEEFLDLLKNSLSLNTLEKKRVIDAMPDLSQFQVDELKKVFLEEREKFRELASEHPEDIKKLLIKKDEERLKLWDIYKTQKDKEETKLKDEQKINDLKKSLGL